MRERFQNPNLTLNQLYEQASQAMPELAEFGQNFLQYLKNKYPDQFVDVEFQQAQLTDLDRVQSKITGDYEGDHTMVANMVRGCLLVEIPEQIRILRIEITVL